MTIPLWAPLAERIFGWCCGKAIIRYSRRQLLAKPRSHRDQKPVALEAARHLKRKNPNTVITGRDAQLSI